MEFHANEGKNITIQAMGRTWARHAITTHFVTVGESYIELMEKYVKPLYQEGDILSMSEKVIAICQKRVVTEEELKPGFWAKVLSRFVHQTSAGPGMGLPIKMQFAINVCGLPKILWAAFRAAIDKLRGIHGTFYKIAGLEVSGLDGFYGEDIPEYAHMGVRIPSDPTGVCDEIYAKTGIVSMIVDANDLDVEMLGHCSQLKQSDSELLDLIRDNPAGQDRQLTPFILIRPQPAAAEAE
ncbi:F420-0--gamma-glutamyl ligase [Pseudoflavonifractor sp. MSJ-37]|uniref:F420-0--gamma-glutamyl ligase n=1 Tax=Pseudoflavonifractor sp. MSJ-37 TaxID=2841531 RepID=UPI001C10A5A7|nr:F420-0--gamma-glutamyl ligase [Pseudoflavonifractor sp. MSJ-37]MBU5435447.1 F420-0--gamma-glutamyl ligase [Pseudoflavonifractor sp. MSJ-37]